MAVFPRVKTWVSNEVLTASDLNGEFNNLLNNTIPASIEDYSSNVSEMQTTADPGGVGTESLATTLAGELTRIRFVLKRIVGGAQWYTAPVIDLGSTISAADIASDAVTTAKILNANVTRAKLEAVGQQVSSSSGTFGTTSATFVDITNLSVSLTTTGRPVIVFIQPSTSGDTPGILPNAGDAQIKFLRDATEVAWFRMANQGAGAYLPGGVLLAIDIPSAGTYTYKAQGLNSGGANLSVRNMKLVAFEL